MKVKDLKRMLNEFSDEDLVIMAKDSEGNNYSPLSSIWEGNYRADSTYSGEVGLRDLTEDDIRCGYGEEDVIEDGENAIILCPIN